MNDDYYMELALEEAIKAADMGEVPIGAIVVKDNQIIGRGFNQRLTSNHVFAHAEMMAIDQACQTLGDWRLEGCTLYVTVEPCAMCAGTMIQARLSRLVYGTTEPKFGAHQSIVRLFDADFNHKVDITSGVLATESSNLLKQFFQQLRKQK
jgi:tRNA(adenine34) deaminase